MAIGVLNLVNTTRLPLTAKLAQTATVAHAVILTKTAQLFWARIRDIKAILRYKNFQSGAPAQF